ncbi:hypothetical protein [Lacimicrobium alkaliphilum]|uniref:Uncharacterized protein n=1 Tax=Lacimicrobium alkaliphilum TaxID=1526571 RepID=A0ABQ1RDP9_9ALTE|nr:hypothetical protein [Lacimicrobium alkaliphilum]GGD64955.1 hypothetical protein GCM10011357_20370 [Lacimicrobium alkaliphilum]
MLEHGEYKLELQGQVLHTWPEGSFNRPGLLRYQRGVLAAAGPVENWILFEHPKNVAAVTNEAMDALGETYKLISQHGCIGIACEVGPLFKDRINQGFRPLLDIPLLASDNERELEEFIAKLL